MSSISINKVILQGNLGVDPEVKYLPSGDAVGKLRLATTFRWKDKETGKTESATEWHTVAIKGRMAENAAEYLVKGSEVYVEGHNRTRKWQGNEGGETRYITEVVAHEIQYGSKPRHREEGLNGGSARNDSGQATPDSGQQQQSSGLTYGPEGQRYAF